MPALYIGDNKNWIEKSNLLFNGKLFITESPFKARSYIFEHIYNDKQPIFIFIEQVDTEKTIKRISQLKKNKSLNQYLILVSEHISRELIIQYMSSGIDEVVSPSISPEGLKQLLNTLPRLHKRTDISESIQIFKLPAWKRTFDIFFSLVALICLIPLLLLTILAIRLESPGAAIYTSQRVGSNYKIFGFFKFRSMYLDAEKRLKDYKELNQYKDNEEKAIEEEKETSDNQTILIGDDFHLTEEEYIARKKRLKSNNFVKLRNDPRITHVGHVIRKFSIDELPQLFNILKGDMSIVGNRPLPLYEAELLTSDEYIERFMAPAGLTGLWQVEKRGMEGILSAEERKQLDIQYARKYSFWLDMKIICRTFTAFIQSENV